jgi:hypothetical protein
MNNKKKPRSPRGAGKDMVNGDYSQMHLSVSQPIYDEIVKLAKEYHSSPNYQGRKPRGDGHILFAKQLLLRGLEAFKASANGNGT